MEKADLKKLQLVFMICCIQKGTGVTTYPTVSTNCAFSLANINYNISLDAGEIIVRTRTWFFGTGKIAESDGTKFTPVTNYSSRLTTYGTYGISLSNVTIADAGIYTYVITLEPDGYSLTATATLSVHVAPLAPSSGCSVSAILSSSTVTCTVNTSSGNCGTPPLNAYWVNSTTRSDQFECTGEGIYQCCATSDALNCYSGSPNDFCIPFHCTPDQTALKLGLGLGLGLGIPVAICISIIIIVILVRKDKKKSETSNHPASTPEEVAFQME